MNYPGYHPNTRHPRPLSACLAPAGSKVAKKLGGAHAGPRAGSPAGTNPGPKRPFTNRKTL